MSATMTARLATIPARLLRHEPRLDDEIAPGVALVRTLHAFVGAGCLMAALASVASTASPWPALAPGVLLIVSSVTVPLCRAWTRWLVLLAGWAGIAVCGLVLVVVPQTPPLAMLLLAGLLAYGNATLGGMPRVGWRLMTPLPAPVEPGPPYDGRIEEQ